MATQLQPSHVEGLMATPSELLVDLKSLSPGSLIDVETRSRHYHIECLGGDAIRISGHPDYCPDPVRAELRGSIDEEGELESGLIEAGRRLMLILNDHYFPFTTSTVISVHVDQPKTVPANSSPGIH
jgi:hypothetical protein